jgi:Protein of unknown function (DUF3592)
MPSANPMVYFAIIIGVFFLVGLGLLGYGIWSARRSTQAANWPTARGVLTNAVLKEESDSDGSTYEVKVEYTYKVTDNEYHGSRLAFGYQASDGREAHAEILEKLKAAKSVDVRYDPKDPSSSALSFGIHRSIKLMLGLAISWLAFLLGLALILWVASSSDRVLLENLSVQ